MALKLRFVGGKDRLPTAFTGQHLQALRRLTPESAALLGGLWAPKTPSIQKNPTWVSDELILTLDLYFRLERKAKNQHHPEVVALSELLNRLPIHTERPDAARFRNPSGVALKLANFLALDPQHTSVGMRRGGRQDRVIWDEFANDRERLRMLAEVIRGAYRSTGSSRPAEDEVWVERVSRGACRLSVAPLTRASADALVLSNSTQEGGRGGS